MSARRQCTRVRRFTKGRPLEGRRIRPSTSFPQQKTGGGKPGAAVPPVIAVERKRSGPKRRGS
eukprot:9494046-Pyramimonas_sp.AAC.1